MTRTPRFITVTIVGQSAVSGDICLVKSLVLFRMNKRWRRLIVRTLKPIVAPVAEKGGASAQVIGISWGGRNTKLHAISDMQCSPFALYLTQGQRQY